MGCLKDSVSIYGLMEATIKEISSKGLEVAMVFGQWTVKMGNKTHVSNIKGIIQWTRNLDMVCMNGKMDGHTKVILRMIIVMVMGSSMI